MKTEPVELKRLTYDPNNARVHPEANLRAIRASLEQWGQVEPLVVQRSTDRVIGGNGRLQVMRELGWRKAQVHYLDLDDQKAQALGVALNRSGELAEWDEPVLANILEDFRDLPDFDFDLGFSAKEIDRLITSQIPEIEQDPVPEPPAKPITKLGDVWRLGDHRVVCGDCREQKSWRDKVSAIVTDPPYHVGKAIANDKLSQKAAKAFTAEWVRAIPGQARVLIAFHSPQTFPLALDAARAAGWRFGRMLWLWKPGTAFGVVPWHGWSRRSECILVFERNAEWPSWVPYHADMYEWKKGEGATEDGVGEAQIHPTLKPLVVVADLIQHTVGVLCDPFLGSGTTLIAAQQLERICHGIEIEPRYVDVTVERWQNLTGGKARRKSA